MNIKDLLKEFNVVIDTAEGLTELCSLILGLAVRGKLVAQDANDEPASELLKKIRAERKRLYDEGEIRKPKKVKKISKDIFPYKIPNNWVWTNLNEAGVINPRNDAEDDLDASFISMSLISEEFMEMHDSEERKWKEIKSGYTHFAENDVGLAKITPCFQNGKAAIFRGLKNEIGAGTTELYIFRSIVEGLIPEYVYAFLRTPDFVYQGVEEMTGTAGQQRVPKGYFEHRPFPLPPANEQHRIVQKIESLFAEVDELEAKLDRQTKLDEKLQLAVNAEVQQTPNADASQSAWTFISSNFDTLYHIPEAIDNLKKNILNEAVRGRLVPQDSKEEPASELLKKIEAEKQRLYEEGEIRKPKNMPLVDEDEIPFEIPESWKWTKLATVSNVEMGQSPPGNTYNKAGDGVPLINGPVEFGNGPLAKTKVVQYSTKPKKFCKEGDLLLCVRGSTLGRTNIAGFDACIGRGVAAIQPFFEGIYLHYFIVNERKNIYDFGTGSTFPSINKGNIENYIFPLPPLEEQHRIVQRIEELFAICDRFKTQLEQREKVNGRLVKGLVQKVLEGS